MKERRSGVSNKVTVFDFLKVILPERERWRLEAMRIISETSGYITSYRISRKLGALGFDTRANTIHPFLETLIEIGFCSREALLKERGHKEVEVTELGLLIMENLKSPLDIPRVDG